MLLCQNGLPNLFRVVGLDAYTEDSYSDSLGTRTKQVHFVTHHLLKKNDDFIGVGRIRGGGGSFYSTILVLFTDYFK